MNIIDFIQSALVPPRQLSDDECAMLTHLSPQGMAKVNCDLSRGVEVELILSQLQLVFRAAQTRRTNVEAVLSDQTKTWIQQNLPPDRPPLSTNELVFLHQCDQAGCLQDLLHELRPTSEDENQQASVSELLPSLAASFMCASLSSDAEHLAALAQRDVTVSHLTPVACPDDLSSPLVPVSVPRPPSASDDPSSISPNPWDTTKTMDDVPASPLSPTIRAAVALSPVLLWFDESDPIPMKVSVPKGAGKAESRTRQFRAKRKLIFELVQREDEIEKFSVPTTNLIPSHKKPLDSDVNSTDPEKTKLPASKSGNPSFTLYQTSNRPIRLGYVGPCASAILPTGSAYAASSC